MKTRRGKIWDAWERDAWKPAPELSIDEWSEEAVILPRAAGENAGPLSWDRVPFAREILQAAKDPDVEEITLCFSAQTCKTTICQAIALYYLAEDPWPILHVMPTNKDAEAICRDRYTRIILESPELARHLTGAKHDLVRDAIRLNGTTLSFAGSNSPSQLASRAICVLILDECDKYPEFSGKEADPIALARERTVTFSNRKIIKASTPTTERAYIWQEFQQGDRRRFWVPCPHCDHYQTLVMGTGESGLPGIKIPAEERDPERIIDGRLAWYECESCHGKILDHHKPFMLRRGRWVPEGAPVVGDLVEGPPRPRRRLSYHLSRLYAPWPNTTFSHIIAEFLRSKDHPNDLMNFRNSWLADVWEDKVDELKAVHLRSRVSGYELGEIPEEARCITAGVDVQVDHFWYVLRAWGSYGESWLIRYGRVENWEAIDRILFHSKYTTQETQQPCPIVMVMVDAGYRTHEVYEYAKRRRCQCIKGAARPLRPYTLSAKNTPVPLATIDTDYYKSKLHRIVRIEDGEPGAWHLPSGVREEYFKQMVSEQRVLHTDKRTGKTGYRWKLVATGAANHLFDAEIYNLVAADILDLEHRLLDKPKQDKAKSPEAPAKTPQERRKRPRVTRISYKGFS